MASFQPVFGFLKVADYESYCSESSGPFSHSLRFHECFLAHTASKRLPKLPSIICAVEIVSIASIGCTNSFPYRSSHGTAVASAASKRFAKLPSIICAVDIVSITSIGCTNSCPYR